MARMGCNRRRTCHMHAFLPRSERVKDRFFNPLATMLGCRIHSVDPSPPSGMHQRIHRGETIDCAFSSRGRRGKDSSYRMEIASREFSTSLAEHGEAWTTNVDESRQTYSNIFSTKPNSDRCQMQRIHIYLSHFKRMASCLSQPRSYALFGKTGKDLLAMIFHGCPLRAGVSG